MNNKVPSFLLAALLSVSVFCAATPASYAQASTPVIESGFSPDGSAINLVLKATGAARSSIRLAAYSFTNPDVVHALIDAKHRGVDVAVVVDERENLSGNGSGIRAISALANAGIPVRTVSAFPIMHNKYQVIDAASVQTGSLNYSRAGAERNAENVIVIWNSPTLAYSFQKDWTRLWGLGKDFSPRY